MQRLPRCLPLVAAAVIAVAAALPAHAQTADHTYSRADIENGSRIYARQCAMCHGQNGDQVANVNLQRQQFRGFRSDEDLQDIIRNGVPAAGMPGFPLNVSDLNSIIAFIRAGFDAEGEAVRIGNAARGREIFTAQNCVACHRVEGVGAAGPGPDLSDIGAIRQPSSLQHALLDPTGSMIPINRPVHIVTDDGRAIDGRRLNEDTWTVQVLANTGQLVSLDKSTLREYRISQTSPMPSYDDRLNPEEISHLVAYLLTLVGQ